MASSHGKFVWYDLMTTDMPAAEKFYGRVVGWGAQDSGMPGQKYTLFTTPQRPVGGLMTIPDEARKAGAQPMWSGYIAVDDVDAYAAKVKRVGGAIHVPPEDIPTVGRFAMVSDPQGAVFALFKGSSEPPGDAAPGTQGHIGWHELHAADGGAAFDFYASQFGWTKAEAMDMGAMGVYQIFARNGTPTGGMMTKPAGMPHPMWLYYFYVDAIDAAAERVKAGGGEVTNGPMEVPGGQWIVQCLDPQGAMFALLGPRK
jgi:predicted enzyme related to lactoylglutathione lyase